ncbi:MAG: two-component regulator propeller domain-containing protein [Bacteroidales bacterium]|nr:two-component regulator propeller domain-containing protein [Bacteroidales bacterium]
MSVKRILGVLLTIYFSISAFSANDIYFSKIGIEQGLSQLSVMSIYQDELGTMWFATREGLNRYNGNSMEVFRPDLNDSNSLGENLILRVYGDKNGHIFIHTQTGINEYDIKTAQMKLIQDKQADAISYGISNLWIAEKSNLYSYSNGEKRLYCKITGNKSVIQNILETSDQRIFVGTLSSGVFLIDQNKKVRQVIPNCSQVANLYEDSKKNIWISTWEQGLYKIERDGKIQNFRFQSEKSEKSISSNFVRVVCEDNNDFLWIGTKKGLDRYSTETGVFKHYSAEEYNNRQLSNESVWSLLKDNQGTIWVGTYFGGVNYFNPDINFYTFHNLQSGEFRSKPFPIISNIIEDKNKNLYLCSEGNGLIYYHLDSKTYEVYDADRTNPNSIPVDNIKAAYLDNAKNELWLGTHLGGLCLFNTNTKKFSQFQIDESKYKFASILSSIQPFENQILVGTHGGLFVFDKNSQQFTLLSEKLNKKVSFIQDVKFDKSGNIWIASTNGVFRFDRAKEKVTSFQCNPNEPNSLSNNNVSKILIDSKNRIWFATSGGGVNLFQPKTNNFKRYDSHNVGLKNDFVSNVIESRFGYILISTTQGFSMLDVENDKIYNFNTENGFPLNSLYSGGMCISSNGLVYLSGMNGMVSFDEEKLSVPHRPFNINFINLLVNNKLVLPNDKTGILETTLPYTSVIKLNHEQTMLTIEFASNNYIPANQPVYRYQLEGYSDSWTELPQGITKLNFMNLSPGKYTLILQAVSPVDRTLIRSADLKIEVFPPFYLTWYAYLFYLILTLFVIWRYVVFSRSKLILETSLTYEKKEKEHLEEVNQSKLRFFTNISHEFRTPLTLISGQVDMLLQMHNIQPLIYNRILNIKRNTQNMSNLINELLEFRKSEQGHLNIKASKSDFTHFAYEIYLSFSEYANYRQIKFNFECAEEKIMLWFDPSQMQKVIYNLISNSFKFTPKDGTITLAIKESSDNVYVEITDTGIGIDAHELEKVFDRFYQAENGIQISNMVPGTGIGLALSKSILTLHSAEIHVKSQKNIGSCFTVTLKKGAAHFSEDQKAEFEDVDNSCLTKSNDIDDEFIGEIIDSQVTDSVPDFSILIVEDNDELRAMLQSIFEPIYKIYTATDGVDGLEKTIEHNPDIVLSDLMMPRMSGSELCSRIKNNFNICHIPVVLLTAQTAIEYTIEGLRLGADDYITKPFNVKTLITRCNNLVNGRKLLQEKFSKQTSFSPRLVATNNMDREFLEKAYQIIEKNMDNTAFDVPFFSREMALGRTNLFSKIKGITGKTPNEFIINVKMKKATELLINHPEMNISEITYMLGFNSPKYFAKCFKEQFGISPSTFRKSDEPEPETDDDNL